MRKKVYNPELLSNPGGPLPVHVRSAGYNEAEPGWEEIESDKPFVQIFWCVQGVGEIIYPERRFLLHPGETFYRLPGELHHHRNPDKKTPWHYYWFTFEGDGAADFINAYGYGQQPRYSGSCPVKLFSELEILVRRSTPFHQRIAVARATEILALMGGGNQEISADPAERFLELAEKNLHDPGFNAETYALQIGIHRSTLNKLCRKKLGMTPGKYLNMIRIQHALQMLKETSASIKEISEKSGFSSPGYFCKVIRKTTSCSPKEYRFLFTEKDSSQRKADSRGGLRSP